MHYACSCHASSATSAGGGAFFASSALQKIRVCLLKRAFAKLRGASSCFLTMAWEHLMPALCSHVTLVFRVVSENGTRWIKCFLK